MPYCKAIVRYSAPLILKLYQTFYLILLCLNLSKDQLFNIFSFSMLSIILVKPKQAIKSIVPDRFHSGLPDPAANNQPKIHKYQIIFLGALSKSDQINIGWLLNTYMLNYLLFSDFLYLFIDSLKFL